MRGAPDRFWETMGGGDTSREIRWLTADSTQALQVAASVILGDKGTSLGNGIGRRPAVRAGHQLPPQRRRPCWGRCHQNLLGQVPLPPLRATTLQGSCRPLSECCVQHLLSLRCHSSARRGREVCKNRKTRPHGPKAVCPGGSPPCLESPS